MIIKFNTTCLAVLVCAVPVLFTVPCASGQSTTGGSQTKGSDTKGSDIKESHAEGSDTKGSDTTREPAAEPVDTAFEKFSNLARELAQNEQLLNKLMISMPVGFPEARRQQQLKIQQLKQRNQQIYRELTPAALESFENFPNTQPRINVYLTRRLSYLLSGKNWRQIPFDPVAGMQLFNKMIDGGIEDPVVTLMGHRASFILSEMEQSRLLLIKAAEQGRPEHAAMENLKRAYKDWLREMRFRKMDAEKDDNPRIKIETEVGDMIVELFEDQAPNSVANFISLVEAGFYDGLTFYQSTATGVVISGSPTNDGLGGPGYKIKCECDLENARQHFTGTLSTFPARRDEGGSRFLITKQPRPSFDGKSTAFGRVIEGLENLYKIQFIDRRRQNNPNFLPTKITRMSVIRKRDHEYVPVKVTASTPATTGN